ncbi:MAG: glutamine synthetase family protein [Actinomycetes bacterium]
MSDEMNLSNLKHELQANDIDVVRVLYPDILGIPRSKDMLVSQMERTLAHGPAFCQGVWFTTTGGDVIDGRNSLSAGLPDFSTRIDQATMREAPWEPGVAYVIADAFDSDGTPTPIAPRTVLKKVLAQFASAGLQPIAGPELEFYLTDQDEDGTWKRAINKSGRVYMTGPLVDPDGVFLDMMRALDEFQIGVFAGNHEFSPSQYEINLWHSDALDAADRTFLFKMGVKEIAAQAGMLATFMGKPWNDEGGSGYHFHLSLNDANGDNVMAEGDDLTPAALNVIGGLIEHAAALSAFTNPTVNAFKRLLPDGLAPYRANWGYDNRSTMIRIPPERGAGARIELRIGDGAANPYIITAVVLAAALDGLKRNLQPPAVSHDWTHEETHTAVLPRTFTSALDALEADDAIKAILGEEIVETFVALKRNEIERYEAAVADPSTGDTTEWELNEYLLDY